MRQVLILAACAAALCACSPGNSTGESQASAALSKTAKLDTDLPMTEFMGHVVDPAAFMYWKGSGKVIDAQGEHDLAPTTDEGWDVLVSGASILMEAGNMLQTQDRVRAPEADWNRFAQMLTERAKVARAAAEKHDKQAVFDEGGRVYEVCVACHEKYVIEPELKANGPAKGAPLPPLPGPKG